MVSAWCPSPPSSPVAAFLCPHCPADRMWDVHLPHRDAAGRTPAGQEASFPSAHPESPVHPAHPLDPPPESPDPRPAVPTAWILAGNLGSWSHPEACPGPSAPRFRPPAAATAHLGRYTTDCRSPASPFRVRMLQLCPTHSSRVRASASLGPATPRTAPTRVQLCPLPLNWPHATSGVSCSLVPPQGPR